MALSTFLIVAQYAPSPNGGVDISLKTASKDTIPEQVESLSDSFLESVKESGAPVSEHLNIMLGLLRDANYEPDTAKRVTHEGVITEWMITFHGE